MYNFIIPEHYSFKNETGDEQYCCPLDFNYVFSFFPIENTYIEISFKEKDISNIKWEFESKEIRDYEFKRLIYLTCNIE